LKIRRKAFTVTEFSEIFSRQPRQVGSIIGVLISEPDHEDRLVSGTLVDLKHFLWLSAEEDFTVLKN
jgi:hypothetical protein